jgi:hypothetical protein
MSTQVSAPHKVASSAIITISSSVALGVARARVVKLGKTRPKPLHAVPLCNQDGKIRSIFPHKKNLQIPYAIPLC